MDQTYCKFRGRLTMATVIVRDPSIAGHDRWETNERAKASLSMEKSVLRRVSAWPMRLLLTTIGRVQRIQLQMPGNRTSITAIRTTTIRITATMCVPSGDGPELCSAI